MANNLGVNSYTIGGDYDNWGAKFVADMAILNKLAGDSLLITSTGGTVALDAVMMQNFSLQLNGGTATAVDIRVLDGLKRYWWVQNDRASGAVTVRCAAGGTAVTVNPTEKAFVYSDGTNCYNISLLSLSIASVTGLSAALALLAPLASPPLTGTPTAPTAVAGTNTTQIATTGFVKAAIDVVLGGVSSAFDTLVELAAGLALKADAAATTDSLLLKLNVAGGQAITGGFTLTPTNLGTIGSAAIVPGTHNVQFGVNGGAFTLTAPASDGSVDLWVTNNATAGAITFSGFTVAAGNTGDPLTTVNGSTFIISIRRANGVSTYVIKALQ